MDLAEIRLVSGELLVVEGDVVQVEKMLSDAARSGQSRLAWFKTLADDVPVGVNPAHVVTLRAERPPSR